MSEPTDHELLADYARTGAETPFAQIVARHIHLVHSAARRYAGSDHLAEEITQAVFLILARKAGSLSGKTVLSGWLYQTARLTAANALKADQRRQRREQEAYMQSQENETDAVVWREIAPLLDDAMGRLGETDRTVLVLRFFERQTNAEVAAALGLAEGAVQKRVLRALEKLRASFAKQGVTHTAQAIAGTVTQNAVLVAPAGLITKVYLIAAKGAATTTAITTLVKGTLKIMAWTKAKMTIAVSMGVLLAAGTTMVVVDKIKHSSVDESFWEMKLENLKKAPPVLIIRPTRFTDHTSVTDLEKVISHNLDFMDLLQIAYANTNSEGDVQSYSRERIILPADAPQGRYDLMFTLPNHPMEKLQQAIRRTTGFAARKETRQTEVLLLKVKTPALLALHVSKRGTKVSYKHDDNSRATSNFPISDTARFLESVFHKPILVQAGFAQHYDFAFRWPDDPQQWEAALTRELDQMGLELVSSYEPIEMLVVEKVK